MKIDIYLDEELYACRLWDFAPRVGGYIILEGPKKGVYKIQGVWWEWENTPRVSISLFGPPEG